MQPSAVEDLSEVDVKCAESCASLPKGSAGDIAKIKALLQHIVDDMKAKEKEQAVAEEWRALAVVLDRLFFSIIAILAVIMIPAFLLQTNASLN